MDLYGINDGMMGQYNKKSTPRPIFGTRAAAPAIPPKLTVHLSARSRTNDQYGIRITGDDPVRHY